MQVPNKCYLTFITAKISQRKSSVQNMCKTNQKKKLSILIVQMIQSKDLSIGDVSKLV